MPDLSTRLRKHPFFSGIPSARLAGVVRHAKWVEWPAGRVVFREGGRARRVYLVCRGRVSVEQASRTGEPTRIETVPAGEVLGWSWFVPPYRWRFDAVAETATQAIALPAAWMRARCRRDPELGNLVMKRTAGIIMKRWTAAARLATLPRPTSRRRPSAPGRVPCATRRPSP